MSGGQRAKSSVLSLSHDPALLRTRMLLLQRAGCKVSCASNLQDFQTCILSQQFDLIMICQSMSAEECDAATRLAREFAPTARVLLMFTRIGKCVPEQADVMLDAHAGPRVLVETAQRMLSSAANQSA